MQRLGRERRQGTTLLTTLGKGVRNGNKLDGWGRGYFTRDEIVF